MREVVAEVQAWGDRGEQVAIATVVDVRRSAPRPPGAKMAVATSGEIVGMVSGGCVEGAVVDVCEEVLRGGAPRLLHFGIADEEAWDVGLPCGGEIDVWVQRFEQRRFAELARAGGRGALVTVIEGPSLGAALLVDADGAVTGSLGDAELDAAAVGIADEVMWAERSERRTVGEVTLFADAVFPPPRIVIFGAVDIAAELCTLARDCGWRPYVVDPRARFATPERFPDALEVLALWPEQALARLGGIDRATYVAVLTHDPKVDDAALGIALRSEAAYVGAMGSRRAQEQRRERLRALGIGDEELVRLHAPIGLDLGALTPEETALSIMAELVATRNGRDGGRLAHARGRIHEVGASS